MQKRCIRALHVSPGGGSVSQRLVMKRGCSRGDKAQGRSREQTNISAEEGRQKGCDFSLSIYLYLLVMHEETLGKAHTFQWQIHFEIDNKEIGSSSLNQRS